jgi:hypothetical protein
VVTWPNSLHCFQFGVVVTVTNSMFCSLTAAAESGINDVTGIDDFDEDVVGTMSLHTPAPGSLPTPPGKTGGKPSAAAIADSFVPSSTPLPASYLTQAMAGSKSTPTTASNTSSPATTSEATSSAPKTARCKRCGLLISRSMEAIEAHMEECGSVNSPHGRNASVATTDKYVLNGPDGPVVISSGMSKSFGGITRRPELENYGTRIIYRTARKQGGKAVRPREVCALQDSFVDEEGTCYVYEISVRHCDVMGLPNYVTADVMVSMWLLSWMDCCREDKLTVGLFSPLIPYALPINCHRLLHIW